MMFLSREELRELTGYKLKSYQKKWLLDSGYKFSVRCDGFPCVLRSHVERILGGSTASHVEHERGNAEALIALMKERG